MTFTVAVAGKGGVGKTTLSALAVKHFISLGRGPVLAIDADPNSNLHEKLGVPAGKTIGGLREEFAKEMDSLPPGVSKTEHIELRARSILAESEGFDLLAMGRPEGPGCYCFVNNLLRTFVDSLAGKYEFVVIDNEAGMEHLSRRTTRAASVLLVVSDPAPTGLRTAARLRKLSSEMGLSFGRVALALNRCPGGRMPENAGSNEYDFAFAVPPDPEIEKANCAGGPILGIPHDSPAYAAIAENLRAIMKGGG